MTTGAASSLGQIRLRAMFYPHDTDEYGNYRYRADGVDLSSQNIIGANTMEWAESWHYIVVKVLYDPNASASASKPGRVGRSTVKFYCDFEETANTISYKDITNSSRSVVDGYLWTPGYVGSNAAIVLDLGNANIDGLPSFIGDIYEARFWRQDNTDPTKFLLTGKWLFDDGPARSRVSSSG